MSLPFIIRVVKRSKKIRVKSLNAHLFIFKFPSLYLSFHAHLLAKICHQLLDGHESLCDVFVPKQRWALGDGGMDEKDALDPSWV